MVERDPNSLSPQELLGLKDEIATRFEQLPSQHQASLALVLVGKVMAGEYGAWMREALTLKYAQQDMLEQWRSLPPDAQAAVMVEQLRTVLDSPQGEKVRKVLGQPDEVEATAPQGLTLLITLDAADLKAVGLNDDEIAALDDNDKRRIVHLMENHYRFDLFWEELAFHTENILSIKPKPQGRDTTT